MCPMTVENASAQEREKATTGVRLDASAISRLTCHQGSLFLRSHSL